MAKISDTVPSREVAGGAPLERGGSLAKASQLILAKEVGVIELVDRKVFNYLLNRAYSDLKVGEGVHRIPVRDALRYLGHSSTDRLRESLARLGEVDIVLDYMDGTVRNEARAHYLSYNMAQAEDGWIDFAFDPILLMFMHDPKIFGTLSLVSFRRFRSNYGAKLYEVMTLYVNRQHKSWNTTVEGFKDLMGVEGDYDRFANLRSRVIEPAVREINEIAPFHVDTEYLRSGKGGKVADLRFTVYPKGQETLFGANEINGVHRRRAVKARDPHTIDLLKGETDAERGTEITRDTMDLAIGMIGEGGSVEAYLEKWRDNMRGRRVGHVDQAFILWLDMWLSKERESSLSLIEEDTFSTIVDQWDVGN